MKLDTGFVKQWVEKWVEQRVEQWSSPCPAVAELPLSSYLACCAQWDMAWVLRWLTNDSMYIAVFSPRLFFHPIHHTHLVAPRALPQLLLGPSVQRSLRPVPRKGDNAGPAEVRNIGPDRGDGAGRRGGGDAGPSGGRNAGPGGGGGAGPAEG